LIYISQKNKEERKELERSHVTGDATLSVFVKTAKESIFILPDFGLKGVWRSVMSPIAAALHENLVFEFDCACA
jgi:hypothetical protein